MRLDDVSTLTLMFNSVSIDAGDPGGLTEAEWKANPRQAPRADQFNTRKSLDQTQAGLRYQRRMSERDELTLTAYHGERHTTQYQSFRREQQLNPANPGGVIVLERKYQGIDTRWKHEDTFASLPVTLIGGLDYETMTERRQGSKTLFCETAQWTTARKATSGATRRTASGTWIAHLQTSWQLTPHWTLDAGLRYSTVSFDSTDYYITPRNGDDSGSKRYHQWLPMGSLNYKINPAWNVYLSAGRGFETPPPPNSPTVPTASQASTSACSLPPVIPSNWVANCASATAW